MRLKYDVYSLKQGVQKFKTKTFMVMSGAVLSTAGLAIAVAMPLAAKADASTVVVTPANTQGWVTQDGAPTYVSGPAGADGIGSLQFSTLNTSKENYFHSTNTPLNEVNGLGYMVYDTSGVPASYQLQVVNATGPDGTGTVPFTSLVWEPAYNEQVNGPNGGFVTESNLESGTWWSSHPIAGDPQGNNGFVSLSQIIAANPNAVVVAFGANVGSGTPNAISYVDDIAFNGTTYNFEPYAVVNGKDQCMNGGWMTVTDANGNSFKNQGLCVAYANHTNGVGQDDQHAKLH